MTQEEKLLQPCICCGADSCTPIFEYTYDFLAEVRKHDIEDLKRKAWTKNTSETIVRCNECGCHYIRDVFLRFQDTRMKISDEKAKEIWLRNDSHKNMDARDYESWLVRNIVILATEEMKRDIKFLDYGAGSGVASNLARAMGVRDVYAYEPFAAYGPENMAKFNFPGIIASRSWEEVKKIGPFDAVVFQSAVEHVTNPRKELETIFNNMTKGGYLFVNNPFMDIEREITALRSAKSIVKSDVISHYHPGHLNYMTPRQFITLLKEIGFEITPAVVNHAPAPVTKWHLQNYLTRTAKIRSLSPEQTEYSIPAADFHRPQAITP